MAAMQNAQLRRQAQIPGPPHAPLEALPRLARHHDANDEYHRDLGRDAAARRHGPLNLVQPQCRGIDRIRTLGKTRCTAERVIMISRKAEAAVGQGKAVRKSRRETAADERACCRWRDKCGGMSADGAGKPLEKTAAARASTPR